MSGRKQHHVPQMLQRGFATRHKKSDQLYVFERDRTPYLTSTAGFGAEKDFYSEDDDSTADDNITEYENKISGFLKRLVDGDVSALDEKEQISSIVSHLEIRSIVFRAEMSFLLGATFDALENLTTDVGFMTAFTKQYLSDNPQLVSDEVRKRVSDDTHAQILTEMLGKAIEPQIGTLAKQAASNIEPLFAIFRAQLMSRVRSTHLSTLKKEVAPHGRAENYTPLTYSYIERDDDGFILPDSMMCFLTRKRVSPILGDPKYLEQVLLPVSSNRLLIGRKKNSSLRTLDQIDRMFASCTYQRFVAKEDTFKNRELTKLIGRNAQILTPAEMQGVFRDGARRLLLPQAQRSQPQKS